MSNTSNSLKQLALQKFKRNFWGVFSLCFIVLVGLVSVFAYTFAPDNSQYANQMHLSIHSKPPGFKVDVLIIPSEIQSKEQSIFNKLFFELRILIQKSLFQNIRSKMMFYIIQSMHLMV